MAYRFEIERIALPLSAALVLAACSNPAPRIEPTRAITPAPTRTPAPASATVAAQTQASAGLTRDTLDKLEALFTRKEQLPSRIYSVADDRVGLYNGEVFEVFDAKTLTSIQQTTPKTPPSGVTETWYALSADARIGAIMLPDGTLDLYDLDTGKALRSMKLDAQPTIASGSDFALNDSGNEAVILDRGRLFRIDTETKEQLGENLIIDPTPVAVQFTNDGRWLTTLSKTGEISVIDTQTLETQTLPGTYRDAVEWSLSADGRVLSISKRDGVDVWSVRDSELLLRINEQAAPLQVAFPAKGDQVLVYGPEDAAIVDLPKRELVKRLELPAGSAFRSARYSLDDKTLYAQGNGKLESYDIDKGNRSAVIQRLAVTRVEFADNDRILAWSDVIPSAELTALDAKDGSTVVSMSHSEPISSTITGKLGRYAASTSHSALQVWQVSDGKKVFSLDTATDGDRGVLLCLTPDESSVVYFSLAKRAVIVRDLADKSVRKSITPPFSDLFYIAPCDNKDALIGVHGPSSIEIMTLQGRTLSSIDLGKTISDSVPMQFSPDSRWLLTLDKQDALIWDTATGQQKTRLKSEDQILDAVFTADGSHVILFNGDKYQFGDINTGKLEPMDIPSGHLLNFLFPPDEGIFVTTARVLDEKRPQISGRANFTSGEIAFWDAKTGKSLRRIPLDNAIAASSISRDGARLAVVSIDGSMTVWGVKQAK